MPRKIRQLIKDLEKVGFEFEPGKGSHRKMIHPSGLVVVVSGQLGGQLGDDARHYQEKAVKEAIKGIKK